jgi:hypothetical protein
MQGHAMPSTPPLYDINHPSINQLGGHESDRRSIHVDAVVAVPCPSPELRRHPCSSFCLPRLFIRSPKKRVANSAGCKKDRYSTVFPFLSPGTDTLFLSPIFLHLSIKISVIRISICCFLFHQLYPQHPLPISVHEQVPPLPAYCYLYKH